MDAHWYLSCRLNGTPVMLVYESPDLAIETAIRCLNEGIDDGLEVGIMPGLSVFNTDDLSRMKRAPVFPV